MVMSGIFLVYIINYSFLGLYSGWCIMFGFVVILVVIFFLGVFVLLESFWFLVKDGWFDEVREVLV